MIVAKTDELVALSGVSRSTVFRFLKGDNIREEARGRILSAMQQLNMPYDQSVSSSGRTLIISIRPDFKYFKGYGLSVVGFMNRAEALGHKVQLRTNPLSSLEDVRKKKGECDGVLILGKTIEEEEAEILTLREAGVPCVLVNRTFDDPRVSWVSIDIETAARDAVVYLMEKGHKRIGTWSATTHYRIDRLKREGYLRAFRERNLPEPDCCLNDEQDGDLEEAVQGLIDANRLPKAWFAASDECAMRFAKTIRENGLSIPDDVVVVGMDDVEPAAYMNPSLTSMHIPYQDAGSAALDVLVRLMDNAGTLSHRIVLKHRLVKRDSCGGTIAADQVQGDE